MHSYSRECCQGGVFHGDTFDETVRVPQRLAPTSEPNDITWRSGWSPWWKITHTIMMSLQIGLCCLGPQYGSWSLHYKLKIFKIHRNSMQFHIDSTGCCCSDTTLFVHADFKSETCVKCTQDLQAKVPKLNISPTMLPIENKQGWYKFRYDHVATYKSYQSNCWGILTSFQAVQECVCSSRVFLF